MAIRVNKASKSPTTTSTSLFLDEEELEKAENSAYYDGWNLASLKKAFVERKMELEEFEDRVELVLLEAQIPTEKKVPFVSKSFHDPYVPALVSVSSYEPPLEFEIGGLPGVWQSSVNEGAWQRMKSAGTSEEFWDQELISGLAKRDKEIRAQRTIAVPQVEVDSQGGSFFKWRCPECESSRYYLNNNNLECDDCGAVRRYP